GVDSSLSEIGGVEGGTDSADADSHAGIRRSFGAVIDHNDRGRSAASGDGAVERAEDEARRGARGYLEISGAIWVLDLTGRRSGLESTRGGWRYGNHRSGNGGNSGRGGHARGAVDGAQAVRGVG